MTASNASAGWVRASLVSFSVLYESSTSFYYHNNVSVSELAPWVGPWKGGSRVNVLGSHFMEATQWSSAQRWASSLETS